MNTKSIFKSVASIAALVLASVASFAGTGTSSDPYTVCGSSGYKLTAATTGAAAYRWKNITSSSTLTATTAALEVTAQTGITSVTTIHYTVEAQSTAGCYSDPQDIYVTLVPAPTLTAPTLANICAVNTGGTASTISLSAPTSSAPTLPSGVTIAWGNWSGGTGTGTITQGSTSGTATTPQPSASGTYTYSITSSYSGMNVGGSACTSTATASITIDALPAVPTTTIDGL